jgi:molybdopterin molybdotransferase
MTVFERMPEAGCGCCTSGEEPSLLSIDAALAMIGRAAAPVQGTESLTLRDSAGRVLAAPIAASAALPPFDNAAMDGYAVATGALSGEGPWRLEVSARIAAGAEPVALPGAASAIRILTGAPIPEGADAVVMQEETHRTGGTILLSRRPVPGENIRRAGEDMAAGSQVLAAGQVMGVREIAAAAAAGHSSVEVRRRLRVALVATGSEIVAPGEALGPAGIWDVNTPMLVAALTSPAVDLVSVTRCADDRDALRRHLAEAAACADLVVTTGGVSVGDEDHVKPALRDLGAELLISGVAVKPGKPVSLGRLGPAFWLGLPGNPVSAFLTFTLFGTALVRALSGMTSRHPARRHVTTARSIRRKPGRCELRPAWRIGFDGHGREVVDFEPAVHSARIARLTAADGVLLLPAETDRLPEGALVDFIPFQTC